MNSLKVVVKAARRYWWLVSGGLTAIFCLELLALYSPQIVKQGIDMLAAGRADVRSLLHLTAIMAALALGVAVMRAVGRPFMLAFGRIVERELRKAFYSHVVMLPRKVIDRKPAGELMARATYDIDNIRLAVGYGFQACFNSFLTFFLALAYMFRMSPMLTFLAAIPMISIPWLTTRQSRQFHNCHKNIQQSFAGLTEESRDSLNSIRLIKVYDLADRKESRLRKASQLHLDNNMELARVSALYLPVMTLVTHMSQAIIWGCGGAMAVLGEMTTGDIVAFSAYLVMLRSPLVYSGYLINLYQRAKSSCRRVDELFDQLPEDTDWREDGIPELAPEDTLTIRNLTFTYPGGNRPALRDISLSLPPGSTSALVGPVGSGKSTLLKLLTRLYEPPAGTIFLGGRDITTIPLRKLRSQMETAPQDPFIFSDTIRENLLLADPKAGENDLWQALADAGLAEEVRALPALFDTVLGEKGHTISGGQKSRLSLAAALLQGRPVLLLDDPLSAVDTRAETGILQNISRLRKGFTNLVISHRPLSLAFCQKIHILSNGRLEAQGSHQELFDSNSMYQRLVLTQQLLKKVEESDDGK